MPVSTRHRSLLVLAFAAAVAATLLFFRQPAAAAILSGAQWVNGLGWIAPFAFIAVFAAAIPLFVPAAPFLLTAGVLFGPLTGSLLGFLGNGLGGVVTFALGRYCLRHRVESRFGSRTGFTVVCEVLRREGLRGAALIRFSPALPAWLINYALGVSPISWRQYLLSSAAILPTVAVYALSGAGVGDLAALEEQGGGDKGVGYYALLATGIAATLAASLLLGRRAKDILEAMDEG